MWLAAPAKLNLFLHVTGRRADGYHTLETVFRLLDFGDRLRFRLRDDGRIVRAYDPRGVGGDDDLVLKAASALARLGDRCPGVEIELDKRIPVGAGLGGGSSDAATTLLALNQLWQLGLEPDRLAAIGLELGADVPVFVGGRSAFARGVGERLAPIELPPAWYVILVPEVTVSTAAVFADPELTRDSRPIRIRDFREGRVRNDLEAVVRRRYPAVDRALEWLGQFGEGRMTGTGAACFIEVADPAGGREIVARRDMPGTGFLARGVDQHPAHRALEIDRP